MGAMGGEEAETGGRSNYAGKNGIRQLEGIIPDRTLRRRTLWVCPQVYCPIPGGQSPNYKIIISLLTKSLGPCHIPLSSGAAPHRPRRPQEASKTAQEGPTTPKDHHKTPKMPPRCPKRPSRGLWRGCHVNQVAYLLWGKELRGGCADMAWPTM